MATAPSSPRRSRRFRYRQLWPIRRTLTNAVMLLSALCRSSGRGQCARRRELRQRPHRIHIRASVTAECWPVGGLCNHSRHPRGHSLKQGGGGVSECGSVSRIGCYVGPACNDPASTLSIRQRPGQVPKQRETHLLRPAMRVPRRAMPPVPIVTRPKHLRPSNCVPAARRVWLPARAPRLSS